MRFLFKSVILLLLFFIVIAFFVPSPNKGQGENGYTTLDALAAVRNTISDLGGFCTRNPETCATGKSFVGSLGEKARDGARFAYEFLDSKFGDKNEQNKPLSDNDNQLTENNQLRQPETPPSP